MFQHNGASLLPINSVNSNIYEKCTHLRVISSDGKIILKWMLKT
jgi:hypothetical protein